MSDELDTQGQDMTTETAAPSRGRRILRRMLLGFGWTLVGLVAVAALLYAFGGMWVRTPEMREAYDLRVDAGTAAPVESRFVIPVPGCVCHSDDPVTQAQHSVRRINECMRCHGR